MRWLTALTYLAVDKNGLTELPPWVGELRRLRFLGAAHNRLESLPDPGFHALHQVYLPLCLPISPPHTVSQAECLRRSLPRLCPKQRGHTSVSPPVSLSISPPVSQGREHTTASVSALCLGGRGQGSGKRAFRCVCICPTLASVCSPNRPPRVGSRVLNPKP